MVVKKQGENLVARRALQRGITSGVGRASSEVLEHSRVVAVRRQLWPLGRGVEHVLQRFKKKIDQRQPSSSQP